MEIVRWHRYLIILLWHGDIADIEGLDASRTDRDGALLILQNAIHDDERPCRHILALLLEHVRRYDDVGDARLVLEAEEQEAVCSPWPLPHDHCAGDTDKAAVAQNRKLGCTSDPLLVEL